MTADEGAKRHGLGRGLSALLGEDSKDYASLDRVRTSKDVPIERLRPGKFQPRRRFDEAETAELVASIRARGILQPILVRRIGGEGGEEAYEIVAGERRWRAAQQAQLHQVPVVVKELSDADALEVALVENLQRQNLTPLEEAEGYKRLMDEFGHTQERLAQALGKSRSHLANTLRLLGLPEEIKTMVDEGWLSAGHARALLTATDPLALAQRALKQNLNVRQVERMAQEAAGRWRGAPATAEKNADTRALEHDISRALGLPVTIHHRGEQGGDVRVAYKTLEQLDEICKCLARTIGMPEQGPVSDWAGDVSEEPLASTDNDHL
ncbi:MAG: ParB/RepB/Spo0J family partition protein [Alphaproteobacteria bacterium]|nr:ParB/RepB/Spo0J family partition protein [Alphaproteobacteria bacterium]